MSMEERLRNWTGPSSNSEQEKQERTERMVRQAISEHNELSQCSLNIYSKGSYANNTNVRSDSDVDIAVECTEIFYWEDEIPNLRTNIPPAYNGIWTPEKLRSDLESAMRRKFPGNVDTSGAVAIQINSNTARVDADVVPCFSYHYYFASGGFRNGTKVIRKSGDSLVNYPSQHLDNGKVKNNSTNYNYKKAVRVLKRIAHLMVANGSFREIPSYFVECLVYNCPDHFFTSGTWVQKIREILFYIWDGLQGEEPAPDSVRWIEVNECFFLFHSDQKWSRNDGRDFAHAAWNYLGFSQ